MADSPFPADPILDAAESSHPQVSLGETNDSPSSYPVELHDPESPASPPQSNTTSEDSSSTPLILYRPPTMWSILRGAAINLLLPFVNGLMLGFGELCAHEAAWWLGWGNVKVFPSSRGARRVGPGVEMRPSASSMADDRRRERELQELTSLE